MFVRGMCICTLWSFQNQCRVNTFMIGATSVYSVLNFFQEKTLHVEGNKIPKANLKCTCRFTRRFNLDTVHAMSRTNRELQIWNEFEHKNDFKQCLLIIRYRVNIKLRN